MKGKFKRSLISLSVPLLLVLVISSAMSAMAQRRPSAPDAHAKVYLAHFAPFAEELDDTSVIIRRDGTITLASDVKFSDVSASRIDVPSERDVLIEVIPTGTSTVAISGTVNLASAGRYTLAAIGDGSNQPLELVALEDDESAPSEGAKLRVGHFAPFASGDAAVDVCSDSGDVILADFSYKDVTDPYLELPAGNYDLLIALAGSDCGDVALDLPSIRLQDGEIVDVFAIGGANNFPLDVATTTGFTLSPATVNVAHFAPFAGSVEDTSVTVRLNGGDALTDFQFGDIATDVELEADEYLVEIVPTGTSTVAISGTVTLEPGEAYTLAAIGDGSNQSLELFPLVDDTVALEEGAKLRVAHVAPFAAGDAAVDVCSDSGDVILADFVYKDVTDPYLELPAGDYDLLIALAGSDCGDVALDLPSITLQDGDIVDLFASGGANGLPLDVASVTGFSLTNAQVSVAHFAPFAQGMENTSVTVRLNGGDAITEFEFSDIVDTELAPGDYLVEIVPTGTSTVAISGTVTLEPGEAYTLAAIGDGSNQPLGLFPLVDDTVALEEGAKLRVAHVAPFAAGDAAVDVCSDSGGVILADFNYKDATDPYLELPAGDYDLLIALAGSDCGDVALDLPSITLRDGNIVDLFAIGGANNFPLDVATTTGFALTPAMVNVGHFAPFAEGIENTAVTVRLNGEDALTDFRFGDIAADVELPAGEYLVEIIPDVLGTVAISGTVTVDAAGEYTLAAIGDGSNQPLELFPLVDDNSQPMDGRGRVRVAHFAPFASGDAAVDVCTDDGSAVIGDLIYKEVTDPYLELSAAAYDLMVTAAGTSCGDMLFDIDPFVLSNGDVVSVYAIGGANGFDPAAITFVDRTSLVLRYYFPFIAK